MTTLRETVQKNLNELQQLLNEYQDDDAFLKAVRAKWTDVDATCHTFVLSCQTEATRLGDEGEKPSGKERINVPTPKTPYH